MDQLYGSVIMDIKLKTKKYQLTFENFSAFESIIQTGVSFYIKIDHMLILLL